MSNYDHAHFERLYGKEIDPWQFRTSAYEAEKYRVTMEWLPAKRFSKCLELGCSIGVLTRALATRCDKVVAVDTSARALEEAAKACAGLPVEFRQAHLPEGYLGQGFDLVVVSEVLYFLESSALGTLGKRLQAAAEPGALCIGVHWTGLTDYPLSADEASDVFSQAATLSPVRQSSTQTYRIDLWRFPGGE
ncbi:MAG: class I SAM-dependent methyltransferase [Pseudomonadota bacterium]|nr:class I SAM-dependent methyltransferase [Pseudomonadota bacterium]